MSRANLYIALSISLSLLAACDSGSQRRLDRQTMDQEIRRREPVRLKEGQIVEAARTQGRAVVAALQQHSPGNSSCCYALPASLLDSLVQQRQLGVLCYSLLENAATTDPLEEQLLEAYRYNLEQQLPLQENIQALGQEHFLYTAPVSNGKTTSNGCGIWSIRLSRKQVILEML